MRPNWVDRSERKMVNSKKKKMSREIVNSEGTVQNEKRRRAT
jgi:hypothetical protein